MHRFESKEVVATGTPAESPDAQCDRVFAAVCQQIANAEIQAGDTLSATKLKRQFGVSDQVASMAFERLRPHGLVWWRGIAAQVQDGAQDIAKRVIDSLSLKATGTNTLPEHQAQGSSLQSLPPWLSQGEPIRWDPSKRILVYASRSFPRSTDHLLDIDTWKEACESIQFRVDIAKSDTSFRSTLQRMVRDGFARATLPLPARDADADTLLLTWVMSHAGVLNTDNHDWHVINYLVASYGVLGAVDIYLASRRIREESSWDPTVDAHLSSFVISTNNDDGHDRFTVVEELLRAHLSMASEADWLACADHIEAVLPTVRPMRQSVLAMLLPERSALSNALALRLAAEEPVPENMHWLLLTATDPAALAAAAKARSSRYYTFWDNCNMVSTVLWERGLDAVHVLAPGAAFKEAGEALACIGTPEAVTAIAKVVSSSKEASLRLSLAANRWPMAAMVALSRLVAAGGKDTSLLNPVLAQLLRTQAGIVDTLRPWLDAAAQAVIDRQLALMAGPREVAQPTDLPGVLVTPPWLATAPKKAIAPLARLPLPMASVERWDNGQREAASTLSQVHKKSHENARKDASQLLDELGMSVHSWFGYGNKEAEERWKSLIPRYRKLATQAIQQGDAHGLITVWRESVKARDPDWQHHYMRCWSVTLLPREMGVEFWNAVAGETGMFDVPFAMSTLGLPALPGLLTIVQQKPTEYLSLALHFGSTDLALPVVRAFAKFKSLRATASAWLFKFPEHAACGLIAPALGKASPDRDCAIAALRMLYAQGHQALLMEVAGRYGDPVVTLALRSLLEEDPLHRFPEKRNELPAWWQPRDWSRPLLLNGKALPDEALDHIGQMLSFPTHEEIYPGIAVVRQACQSASLADFAFDCFGAWLQAGAPNKEGWALTALGLLGNDDTARKLTPFIRAWPGESAHARAVSGLDVLAKIGTDTALMLLNGIAQKVKFKGLQDKAREKIDAIAQARELSIEELEDRLAPDLGLDEQGTLLLDFGPRSFKAGFDEALKPYVRECDAQGQPGARIADLPKPKKTDDPQKSAEAVERYKLLKKDARTIASQQLLRLEVAMCIRRRWSPELFRTFLVEHPLVRHIVQRLVWGVYELPATEHITGDAASVAGRVGESSSGNGNYGGTLKACFRVAEDGSYSTADDEPFALPEATTGDTLCIGVPHALELSAADAAAFGQVFADYELLQPFAQIGRDTWSLTEAENKADKFERWDGVKVPTGKVLGLVNKGWRRGAAQDGGGIGYFTKALGPNLMAELDLAPGIIVGMVDEYPEQSLGVVKIGSPSTWGGIKDAQALGTLDAIAASELIRDLEALRV